MVGDILSRLSKHSSEITGDEKLDQKLRSVAKYRGGKVRLLCEEEVEIIQARLERGGSGGSSSVLNGGYIMVGTAQIAVQKRDDGQWVSFKL
jgi:hypothetical protein